MFCISHLRCGIGEDPIWLTWLKSEATRTGAFTGETHFYQIFAAIFLGYLP
jgi:hypothetical protein